MHTRRIIDAARWLVIAAGLAGIVALYLYVFRAVTPTTVALTLLFFILVLAANWSLRYAIAASVAATALFNYYFLPPTYTFTIEDTQNWIALLAFLCTAIFASHLSNRIREETEEANRRRRESEMLYRLGRQLLEPGSVPQLLNAIPSAVANVFGSPSVTLYLAEGDRIYLSDPNRPPQVAALGFHTDATGDEPAPRASDPNRSSLRDELRETMLLPTVRAADGGHPSAIPLHIGVRPLGVLLMESVTLSRETMEALSGLVSMSIERAEALESSARSGAAQENERLRTALLDSVTHDLRTPLTAIKASVSALLSQPTLDKADRAELLTIIDEESDRLNRLIEQAVEMAQLDANKVQLDLRPEPVAPLIQSAVEECLAASPSREIRISLARNLPPVLADQAWVRKVLTNLLENAIKYSPAREPIFVIATPIPAAGQSAFSAAARPSANQPAMLAISVADRGSGIEPLEQEMIFDKFYRGQGQRERIAGTGMGLAISRAIVAAHGGTISVTSQPGHGSVFTFTLPTAR